MAKILEVRGYGYFTLALRPGDANRLQLAQASPDAVAIEVAAGNVPVMVPVVQVAGLPTVDSCPARIVDGACVVAGSIAPKLEGVGRRVVEALIRAFPAGLTSQGITAETGVSDPRNALKDLVTREPLWRAAVRFPREKIDHSRRSLGYRIGSYGEVIGAMQPLIESGKLDPQAFDRAIRDCDFDRDPLTLDEAIDESLDAYETRRMAAE